MVDDYLSYGAQRVFTCQTLSDVIENVNVEETVETCGVCLPEVQVRYFSESPMGSQWAKNYFTRLLVQRTRFGAEIVARTLLSGKIRNHTVEDSFLARQLGG